MRAMRVAIIIGACLGLAGTAAADTIYVAQDGTGDYTTIQAAMNAAQDGDEILIYPGTYYERPVISGKSLSLIGLSGRDVTIIDGQDGGRVCDISDCDYLVVEGLTIQGGRIIDNNSSDGNTHYGGGLRVENCSLTMRDSVVQKNYLAKTANNSDAIVMRGGGVALEGSGTFQFERVLFVANNCSIAGANSSASGAAVYTTQLGTYTSCRAYNNTGSTGFNVATHSIIDSCHFRDSVSGTYYLYNSVMCGGSGTYIGFGNVFSCDEEGTMGACCADEFGCEVMTQRDCFQYSLHPRFGGPGSQCDTPDCTTYDPYGACCVAGGCGYMRQSACEAVGGDWHGDYVPCESVSCPVPPALGSCCVVEACIQVTEDACAQADGRWQGDLVPCADADCTLPPAVGACCVGSSCLDVTQAACFKAQGIFAGELTTCGDTTCPSVCSGDVNLDNTVDVNDILLLIANYGPCP
ncbi:MAG: hypothetical protein MK116_07895 [Phycisphaerales bacterium]|nr:hypothetical protein [Phycisphaerales bacterium]